MIYNADKRHIKLAAQKILEGDIIVYPTDTLYGFGVDATNSNSINKLNKLKKRNVPLSIIVSSIEMLEKYANFDICNKKIINNLLPGAFTLLLKSKQSNLSNKICLNSNKIGIRIPKSTFILDVVNLINKPIVTTSVNINNSPSLNDVNEISLSFSKINIFKGKVNKKSKGSTIIDFSLDKPQIVRIGDGNFTL